MVLLLGPPLVMIMRRSTSSSPVEAASAVEDAVLSAVEEAVLSAAEEAVLSAAEEAVLPPQAARLTHIAAAIVAAIIFFFIWCSP